MVRLSVQLFRNHESELKSLDRKQELTLFPRHTLSGDVTKNSWMKTFLRPESQPGKPQLKGVRIRLIAKASEVWIQ